MCKRKIFINGIFILVLLVAAMGNSAITAQAGGDSDSPKADPRLLQMAADNPDAVFMVIVQKEAKNKDLEDEVRKGGGKVKKQLDLIVSFSAEMTGKEITKLAKNPKVRWISVDAPMVSTGTGGLTSVLDNFTQLNYAGNNGTELWFQKWKETGDTSSDPVESYGNILLTASTNCASGNCLRLDPSSAALGAFVYRQVDLSKAASAILSFSRNNRLHYDSGTSEEVKVEVSSNGGATWTTLQTYSSTEFLDQGVDTFDITSFMSASTQVRFLISGQQSGDRYIYFDNIKVDYAYPSPYRDVVGADKLSLNGQGVTVAVVDSGVTDHIDLHSNAANVSQAASSASRIVGAFTFGSYSTPNDEYEHGSHVAGIVGGNGVASNGKYKGVAPGVNLLNLRVSNNQGLTYTSDLIAALQWIYENKAVYNIRVVNISINSTVSESYHTSPLDAAVEILWFNGIVVVVAAGNNGTADGPSIVYPPANDPFVITVGALEDRGTVSLSDDFVGAFSAYQTTSDGFAKPDLVAPGRNLISLLASTTVTAYAQSKHRVDSYYFRMSGTSMAAPVVTGAVALLLQDEPNLSPDQVKYRLMATAAQNWTNFSSAKAGAGTLDAFAAVNGTTTDSSNQGIVPSQMLASGSDAVAFNSVGWNSVGWNSVGWNSVGWNSVGWNSVGWNSVGWNSVGWNSVGWSSSDTWDE